MTFDADALFDDDYLYFCEQLLTAERSDEEAELIWRLGELDTGCDVLDAPCGHGRLANRVAARGCRVTGLDRSEVFLELARADAELRDVEVEYVKGDVRSHPWRERFDCALIWFTCFGYFDDDTNHAVLAGYRKALRPGGRLLMESISRDGLLRGFQEEVVTERGSDRMIDRHRFDPLTGRNHTERTIVRDGRTRQLEFSIRTLAFTELRDWLLEAGFGEVHGLGRTGEALTLDDFRMVVIAGWS